MPAGRAGWSSTGAIRTCTASRPAGPGRQVVIGGPEAKFRGVKDLIVELQLMPVEGGARVAIIESADRMNEDAQSALLKTLEEPPAGVTILLCADQEARLLPTVRSRCFRLRLGLVGARDIEAILADHGLADPPTAARLGRLAGGRPGLALAYARAPGRGPHPCRAHARPARPDRRPAIGPPGRGPSRDPARHRPGGRPRSGRPGGRRSTTDAPARTGRRPGDPATAATVARPPAPQRRRRRRCPRGRRRRPGQDPGGRAASWRRDPARPVGRCRARPRPGRDRRLPVGPRHGPAR